MPSALAISLLLVLGGDSEPAHAMGRRARSTEEGKSSRSSRSEERSGESSSSSWSGEVPSGEPIFAPQGDVTFPGRRGTTSAPSGDSAASVSGGSSGSSGDSSGSSRAGAGAGSGATGQHAAQTESSVLNQSGASFASSVGVVSCGEAANTLQESPATSGLLLGSCLNSFAAARQMQANQNAAAANAGQAPANGLGTNADVLASPVANSVFSDLENSYGVKREDLTRFLVANKGDPEALGRPGAVEDLFHGKITSADLEKALSAADQLSAEEKEKLLAGNRVAGIGENLLKNVAAGGSEKTGRRLAETIRQKLSQDDYREPASLDWRAASRARGERAPQASKGQQQPLEVFNPEAELGISGSAETREESIFDVVHSKYSDLARRMSGPRKLELPSL